MWNYFKMFFFPLEIFYFLINTIFFFLHYTIAVIILQQIPKGFGLIKVFYSILIFEQSVVHLC